MSPVLKGVAVTHTAMQALIALGVVLLAVLHDIDGTTAVGVLIGLAGIGGGQAGAAMAHAQAEQQSTAVAKAVAIEHAEQ